MRRRMLDEEEQFLVRWQGEFEPTWEKGEMIRSDCPDLVEQYMQVFCIHNFVFAWYTYTCISATCVGFGISKSIEWHCPTEFIRVELENRIWAASYSVYSVPMEAHPGNVEVATLHVSTA